MKLKTELSVIFVEDHSDDLPVPTTLRTLYETLPEAQRTKDIESIT